MKGPDHARLLVSRERSRLSRSERWPSDSRFGRKAAVASLVGAGTNRTPIAAGRSTALVPDASSYLSRSFTALDT